MRHPKLEVQLELIVAPDIVEGRRGQDDPPGARPHHALISLAHNAVELGPTLVFASKLSGGLSDDVVLADPVPLVTADVTD